MPYPNIQDIRFANIKSQLYFLDTNIWLVFISQIDNQDNKKFKAYLDLVDKIFSSTVQPAPKIMLTNLQVSEIVNAYLRQIAMRRYQLENHVTNQGPDYYKSVYRMTEHFKKHHQLIRDEIKSYRSYLETIDDHYNALNPYILLDEVTTKMDYNDFFYYKLCVHLNNTGHPVSIVTHDHDFKFKDIEIITDNSTLKNLRYLPE